MGQFHTFPDLPGVFRGVERRISAIERTSHGARRVLRYDPTTFAVTGTASAPDVLGELNLSVPADGAVSLFLMAGLSNVATGTVAMGVRFGSPGTAFSLCQSSLVSADPAAGELRLSVPGSTVGVNGFGGGPVILPASGDVVPVEIVAWNVSGSSGRVQFAYAWAWAV